MHKFAYLNGCDKLHPSESRDFRYGAHPRNSYRFVGRRSHGIRTGETIRRISWLFLDGFAPTDLPDPETPLRGRTGDSAGGESDR